MPIKLHVRRIGEALIPFGPESTRHVQALPEHRSFKCLVSKPRSSKAHRMYFGVIAVAFAQWPEAHEFEPESAEHLRAWLQCKVGHCTHIDVPVVGDAQVFAAALIAVIGMVRSEDKFCFPRPGRGVLRVYFPKTINTSEAGPDHSEFTRIAEAVYGEISAALGVPIEEFKREAAIADAEHEPEIKAVKKAFPGAKVVAVEEVA